MQKIENLKIFVECKDHTVSNESFKLYHDDQSDMLITYPKPNDEDLGKYYESEEYISHTDSKKTFIDKLYQLVKSFALSKKTKLITQLNKGEGSLLDLGAGTGDFLIHAKSKGWNVCGVEPNANARALSEKKGISLEKDSLEYHDKKFDVITMWHVLEHVPDLEKQIIELKRLLKINGHIVIAVPNFRSYDASYYGSFWAAYDVPRHLWHFSKKSIKHIFGLHQMKLTKVLPMKFDSFYVSMLSEKYKTSKINFFKACWIGLRSNLKAISTKEYSSLIYVIKNDKNLN